MERADAGDRVDSRTLWLGRALMGASPTPASTAYFRVWTQAGAPQAEDPVEWIEDPFCEQGQAETHVFSRVSQAKPLNARIPAACYAELELRAPVRASKVIGIGRNYRAHAEELGNEVPTTPLSFLKAPSCLLGSGQPIELPRGYSRIDMESELVVMIGRRARSVQKDEAWNFIGGYTLGNDVSCRDLQKSDKQWTRAKGFDGFGPLGPVVRVTPPGFVPPIPTMKIRGSLDGELRQEGGCELMIFDIGTLIEHLSEGISLEPGDLIYTGTPAGVSALKPGQEIRIEMGGFALGVLTNPTR